MSVVLQVIAVFLFGLVGVCLMFTLGLPHAMAWLAFGLACHAAAHLPLP